LKSNLKKPGKLRKELRQKIRTYVKNGMSYKDALHQALINAGLSPLTGSVDLTKTKYIIAYLMSRLRNFKVDKNNNGIDDFEEMGGSYKKKQVKFPEDNFASDPKGISRDNLVSKIEGVSISSFTSEDEFLMDTSYRRYYSQRKYKVIPGQGSSSLTHEITVTFTIYKPIQIAVNYEGTITHPGNIEYIDLWQYFWYELSKANLDDDCDKTISVTDAPGTSNPGPPDHYNLAGIVNEYPLPYPK
jgi:hypothetical protein